MKRFIWVGVAVICLASCKRNKETVHSGPKLLTQEDSLRVSLNIQMMNFSEIDSSGILIFPLQMGQNKNVREEYDYKEMEYNDYWNLVFYDSKTKDYHLLTEEKMMISEFDYNYGERSNAAPADFIFYEARSKDFNKDKLLNRKDPVYLYVSDKAGKNFRQISPSDYSLDTWKFVKSSNKIIMNATKDSNGNLLFDGKDEITTFELVLGGDEKPIEVFSDGFKSQLRALYNRDWKRIK